MKKNKNRSQLLRASSCQNAKKKFSRYRVECFFYVFEEKKKRVPCGSAEINDSRQDKEIVLTVVFWKVELKRKNCQLCDLSACRNKRPQNIV